VDMLAWVLVAKRLGASSRCAFATRSCLVRSPARPQRSSAASSPRRHRPAPSLAQAIGQDGPHRRKHRPQLTNSVNWGR
jgi:hypothetical protein